MSTDTFKKVEIARMQLETALKLFFDKADPFSIITLAGAAEEILGRLLELEGESSALKEIVKNTALVHKHLYGEELPHKTFRFRANMARNSIKHLDSKEDLTVTFDHEDEMIDMLVRATDNYWGLDLPESDLVTQFHDWYMEYVVGV